MRLSLHYEMATAFSFEHRTGKTIPSVVGLLAAIAVGFWWGWSHHAQSQPVVWVLTLGDGIGETPNDWCVYDETGLEVCAGTSKGEARANAKSVARERNRLIRIAEMHGDAVWQFFCQDDKEMAQFLRDQFDQ